MDPFKYSRITNFLKGDGSFVNDQIADSIIESMGRPPIKAEVSSSAEVTAGGTWTDLYIDRSPWRPPPPLGY